MGRKLKKKSSPKKKQKSEIKMASTNEIISEANPSSDNIVRLKLTTRKGTRIESVPSKKLKKLASKKSYIGIWKMDG